MKFRLKEWCTLLSSFSSSERKEREHLVKSRSADIASHCGCMANILRTWISKNRNRYVEDGFNLDLCYVTNRIIAMGYPAEGGQGLFRNPRSEIVRFLTLKHKDHYRVYNLCVEQTYDANSMGGVVAQFPFGDHQAPPLGMIADFCEDAERWLLAHPRNTVVVHCKAGKGRTGIMICALLMYMGICMGPDESLRLFAQKRTADGRGVTIPSQRRYIYYFYELMASGMRLSSSRIVQLQYIRLTGFSRSMLSKVVVCLYGRDQSTREMMLLATIKSAANTKNTANNVHSLSPSGNSSIGLFPHGERYHLLMNNTEFYVIFEIDAGTSPRWMLRGDFKIQVFEDSLSKRNSLFHTWLNTTYLESQHVRIRRHEMDKVMRSLPSEVQMEIKFSDPCSWTSSLSARGASRFTSRINEISRSMNPSRGGRRSPAQSVVASSTLRYVPQDQAGPSSILPTSRVVRRPTSFVPGLSVPCVPKTTEDPWIKLTRNWDKNWMSITEKNPSISQQSCK